MQSAFLLAMAAFMLFSTIQDIRKHKTSTVSILPWWAWFDVSREKKPVLYWFFIGLQFLLAFAVVVFAFWAPPKDPN